ncbi:MAG: sugar ABC transporter permease [Trueperaceae bacterium]|nr:sugar ABC transporter permease [Trueperaceae bacterium]
MPTPLPDSSTKTLREPHGSRRRLIPKWRRRIANELNGYLFVLPALLLIGVFFGYPLLRAFQMSFYDWPVLGSKTFIGFQNYVGLLNDGTFIQSMRFTLLYTVLVTPAIFLVAFLLAVLVDRPIPGISLFRGIYFLPVVMSFVAASLIWLWIYHDLFGLLNYVLLEAGIIAEPVVWMGEITTSLPAIIVMIVWKTAGFSMMILLAGMQSIPRELYESASLDGASATQRVRHVMLPLLKPSFALALIVSMAGSFLAFDHFVIMTRGGPANATKTVMMHIYDTSFLHFRLGAGSAMAVVLLLILLAVSVVQIRLLRSETA